MHTGVSYTLNDLLHISQFVVRTIGGADNIIDNNKRVITDGYKSKVIPKKVNILAEVLETLFPLGFSYGKEDKEIHVEHDPETPFLEKVFLNDVLVGELSTAWRDGEVIVNFIPNNNIK